MAEYCKPDDFMGGCDYGMPSGPKRKVRTSWMKSGGDDVDANDNSNVNNDAVEEVEKELEKVEISAEPKEDKTPKEDTSTESETEHSDHHNSSEYQKPDDFMGGGDGGMWVSAADADQPKKSKWQKDPKTGRYINPNAKKKSKKPKDDSDGSDDGKHARRLASAVVSDEFMGGCGGGMYSYADEDDNKKSKWTRDPKTGRYLNPNAKKKETNLEDADEEEDEIQTPTRRNTVCVGDYSKPGDFMGGCGGGSAYDSDSENRSKWKRDPVTGVYLNPNAKKKKKPKNDDSDNSGSDNKRSSFKKEVIPDDFMGGCGDGMYLASGWDEPKEKQWKQDPKTHRYVNPNAKTRSDSDEDSDDEDRLKHARRAASGVVSDEFMGGCGGGMYSYADEDEKKSKWTKDPKTGRYLNPDAPKKAPKQKEDDDDDEEYDMWGKPKKKQWTRDPKTGRFVNPNAKKREKKDDSDDEKPTKSKSMIYSGNDDFLGGDW